ncbi:MAG: (Fe-S)-binding protein [Candidatus Helarchaeota archaeon]
MKLNNYKDQIESCIDCKLCLDVCPIYLDANDDSLTPINMLEIAKKILNNEKLEQVDVNAPFSCPKCGACLNICPESINVPAIVAQLRNVLFNQKYVPFKSHASISNSILTNGNSVNKSPDIRWDWFPKEETFPENSSTLFFVGCLPNYFIKGAALSSYNLLKKINYDFRLLKDEGCCGSIFYDTGNLEQAEILYKQNLDKFDDLGIKKLIISCSGCYKAFRNFYPEITGEKIETVHIIEVLNEALKAGKLKFKKLDEKVTYHDPCNFGRFFGMFEEPRNLLNLASDLTEMEHSKENTMCCGAGSAVRSAFKNLSVRIALKRVDEAEKVASTLVSTCPFCVFNLGYAVRKNNRGIKVRYITEILDESII